VLRTVLISLGVVLVAVILAAVWVGTRALIAKNALEDAQTELQEFRSVVGTSDGSTAALYSSLQKKTTEAADATGDPVWAAAEKVPWIGPNLAAVRKVASLVDGLVSDGVGPVAKAADGLSLDSIKPKDGRIDIAPLQKLAPALAELDTAMTRARTEAAAIDTEKTVSQISGAVAQIDGLLSQYQPTVAEASKVMPYLFPALGGEGARHYLLMFQNNAEERASGGNPASMVLLTVDKGAIEMTAHASSLDFDHPYPTEPLTFGGDWDKLYGPYTSTYVTNITFTPDFPTTARLAQKMWDIEFGQKVDGVISFDPVALSYLLKATGPITLESGEELTAENAVDFLLAGVYARYDDPRVQDAVFASAAASIFSAVTSGQGDPKAYLEQLAPMIDQQRLKIWSSRKDEEELLLSYPVGNMLPADNSKSTAVGVYYNDDSTSKMSYYMNATIDLSADLCTPGKPAYRVTTAVTDTLDPGTALGLPRYVLAYQPRIPFAGDRQWVNIYGPVGSKLTGATVDGEAVTFGDNLLNAANTVWNATGVDDRRPAVSGRMHGRPVAVVSVKMGPGETVEVAATFAGADDPSDQLRVSHTPKVRDVPVTINAKECG
jgi:hypothetical protein